MKCIISAPVETVSGYGARSRDIIRALFKQYPEWDFEILSQAWGNTPTTALDFITDMDIISRINKSKQLDNKPDVWIQITVPNEFQAVGTYNIGISAGIETDRVTSSWLEGANRMNLILVSSEHSKKVFINSVYTKHDKNTHKTLGELRLTTPIDIIFEGSDIDIYKPLTELELINSENSFYIELSEILIKEKFCFLYLGHWTGGSFGQDRKDVSSTISVYCETFKSHKNPPALLLKTNGATFSYMDQHNIESKINSMNVDNLPIYLIHGQLTDAEINILYNHPKVKAFITTTHGEGYGRPLQEFALIGKPIIAPNYSGQLDFLNIKYTTLISGQLGKIHPSAIVPNAMEEDHNWFFCNYQEFSQSLTDLFFNYKNYLKPAQIQMLQLREEKTLDKMANKLKELIDSYNPGTVILPKISLPKLVKVD